MENVERQEPAKMGEIRNRNGKIRMPGKMFREIDMDTLDKIFSKIFIFRAEHYFHNDIIEYLAVSPHFDEHDPKTPVPVYEPTVTQKMDDEGRVADVSVVWNRVEWV